MKNIAVVFSVIVISAMFLGLVSDPTLAQQNQQNQGGTSFNICNDAADTAQTMRDIFMILQILGPVFGTLFFTGMSVADAAKTQSNYSEQRRKVLLLGFGVPVAVVFLESIANNVLLPGTNIGCFFPG